MNESRSVYNQFERAAPHYRWMPLRFDGLRRHTFARHVARTLDASGTTSPHLIDLACGSGIATRLLDSELTRLGRRAKIIGVDFCPSLLALAQKAPIGKKIGCELSYQQSDACALPFDEGTFDAATIAFGVRYVRERSLFLAEALRVLRPGGLFFVLETHQGAGAALCRLLLPLFSSLNLADNRKIAESFLTFPSDTAFSQELRTAGFYNVERRRLLFSNVVIHTAQKPA